MAWPVGVETKTVTLGPILNSGGEAATLYGKLTLDDPDRVLRYDDVTITAGVQSQVGTELSYEVAEVDQDGFTDANGVPIENWGYIWTVVVTWQTGPAETRVYTLQPVAADDDTIDLDTIDQADLTPATHGVPTRVYSVVGEVGDVTAEQLSEALGLGDLGGGDVTTAQLEAEVSDLEDLIDAEATTRSTADTGLTTAINNEVAARSAAITAEIAARNAAISSAVSTEATARAAADTAEVTARNAAITAAVATEATARSGADSTEAAARAAADTALGAAITAGLAGKSDTGHTHTQAEVTGLLTALSGKATAAQGALADTAIQPADLVAAIDDLLGMPPGTLDTLGEIAQFILDNDDILDALVLTVAGKASQAALDAEIALARNADNLTSGTVADARIASTITRDSELTAAIAAAQAAWEAFASNGSNITSGTIADARIAGTIARDSEVAAAQAAAEATAAAALSAHLTDNTDAHDASAISASSVGLTQLSGDDVQEMLGEADAVLEAHSGDIGLIAAAQADLAPKASPTLTGDPKAPTPAANDNDTSIATTAYVQTELTDYASDTKTLTNKRVTKRVQASASTATFTFDADAYDEGEITAQAAGLTLAAPSGTPTSHQGLIIRIKDNGTARGITWTTGSSGAFRAVGVTLPTTTVISKTLYIGAMWNAADSRWDVIAVAQEA